MSNPAAMSNPTGPDGRRDADQRAASTGDDAAAATEIFEPADPATDPTIPVRRFTAPSGFDGKTQIIAPLPDPETEMMPPAVSTSMKEKISRKDTRILRSLSAVTVGT